MAKIIIAFCEELQRNISIDMARYEYFSLPENQRKRFTFYCSDLNCRVLMSGVNYDVKAQEDKKFKTAHFRSPHKHKPDCEWLKFTEEIELPIQKENESDNEFKERQARQKLHDWVNYFDPVTNEKHQNNLDGLNNIPLDTSINLQKHNGSLKNQSLNRFGQYTRTNQLQRLIDTWIDAKKHLHQKEIYLLNITIRNYGKIPFHKYITPISQGLLNEYSGVIFGGATLKKRYGKGFLLSFYDKHNNNNIELYISPDKMNNSRLSHYIDEVLNAEDADYFQIFLLSPTNESRKINDKKEVIQLNINNLNQLVIYYKSKK